MRWQKMLDLLPEASLGFRSILFQTSFVNQAFLGLRFFQVQGRNHEILSKNLGLALIQLLCLAAIIQLS
jgi:hypothetical protein